MYEEKHFLVALFAIVCRSRSIFVSKPVFVFLLIPCFAFRNVKCVDFVFEES